MTDLKCMYCAELGITNTDVFIEIVDVELGAGWICKECFLESEKEKDEHLKELEQELKRKEQECKELKDKNNILKNSLKPFQVEYFKGLETIVIAELAKKSIRITAENRKLEQTLTEIKEIAEEAGNTQYLTFPDFNLKQNAKMLMGQFNGYLQQIIQKISEVENEIINN